MRTTFRILAPNLGDSITDLVSDVPVGLLEEILQKLGADVVRLFLLQRHEHVGVFRCWCLPRLGGYPSEDDGGVRARLEVRRG